MAKQVLSKKVETIRRHHFYSIICNEGTDYSNIEKLPFRIRMVDENLDTQDFFGFYKVHIKSNSSCNKIDNIKI